MCYVCDEQEATRWRNLQREIEAQDRAWSERLANARRNREASQSVQDSVQVEVSGDAQAIGREIMSALSAMDNRYSIGFTAPEPRDENRDNLVTWATHMFNEVMYSSSRYVPRREVRHHTDEEEPGAHYEPHGQIHTEPDPETAWNNPHHWPSTVERSPYWHREDKVLKVPGSDTYLIYTKEELDEDVRYV